MFGKLALVVLFSSIETAYLPTFFAPKCNLSDRRINECIIRAANKVIPKLANGYVYYNIPQMKPLHIPGPLVLKESSEMHLELSNVYVFGLENTKLNRVNFSVTYVSFTAINPLVTILADYKADGKCLNTPIFGSGYINATLVNGVYDYEQYMPNVYRDGEWYFNVTKPKILDYRTEKSIYYLDNLYNGDEYLGNYMNEFLNKNWRSVQRILKPLASPNIAKIFFDACSGIGNNVPINQIYGP